ncbi:uncharacterized protein [Elaeis guineensis]|uniref:Uncharacterized protein LOC114913969 n=1 Tax=Elaeis guineensis var. tenera TaxID=51953 RepID=A0A8N4EU06_ELAGV|nr:uncharacterized protein LOC114913969 [Elaeis guineensis]
MFKFGMAGKAYLAVLVANADICNCCSMESQCSVYVPANIRQLYLICCKRRLEVWSDVKIEYYSSSLYRALQWGGGANNEGGHAPHASSSLVLIALNYIHVNFLNLASVISSVLGQLERLIALTEMLFLAWIFHASDASENLIQSMI